MELQDFYAQVPLHDGTVEIAADRAVHTVLVAMACHLTPREAKELAAVLPRELRAVVVEGCKEEPHEFDRDAFIEEVASRLDLDDDEAEHAALAVLGAIRDGIHPRYTAEQVIEALPSDLAHLIHESP